MLTDESMPEMTGTELTATLRQIRPDLPILLMTGFASPEIIARARSVGVNDVLAKPMVSRDIARSLANALYR